MTGESRPGERSSGAGSAPAAVRCFVDGAGAAAAGGRGSEGAEASGVKKPTWRILGSTPPDEERGGRRRSIAADGEGLGWGLRWDTRASDSRRAGGRGWRLETGDGGSVLSDRAGLGWAGPSSFFFQKILSTFLNYYYPCLSFCPKNQFSDRPRGATELATLLPTRSDGIFYGPLWEGSSSGSSTGSCWSPAKRPGAGRLRWRSPGEPADWSGLGEAEPQNTSFVRLRLTFSSLAPG
jgi:hypothetical protein